VSLRYAGFANLEVALGSASPCPCVALWGFLILIDRIVVSVSSRATHESNEKPHPGADRIFSCHRATLEQYLAEAEAVAVALDTTIRGTSSDAGFAAAWRGVRLNKILFYLDLFCANP